MPPPTIACIGGAHLDHRGTLRAPVVLATSNPGAVHTDFGGVARNVAQNLTNLGTLYGLSQHLDLFAATRLGLAAAAITIESADSAVPHLTPEALYARA